MFKTAYSMKALATQNSPVPESSPFLKNPNVKFLDEVKNEVKKYGHLYDETIPDNEKPFLPNIVFKNWRQVSARGNTGKSKRIREDRVRDAKKQEYGSKFKDNSGVVRVWM